MQVHVDRGGERFGPYSLEEVNAYLANGTLLPTDQAWHDGMTDWVPISQITGVTIAGGSPPPAAGATCPQCQAPVEESQVICIQCGRNLTTGQTAVSQGKNKYVAIRDRVFGMANAVSGFLRQIIDKIEKNQHRTIIWRSLGAVGVMILGGVLFFIFNGNGDDEYEWLNIPTPNNAKARIEIHKAIKRATGKSASDVTEADLKKLTAFSLRDSEITDLKPFLGMKNLEALDLSGNKITNLKPLAVMTKLKRLTLQKNQITDLKPLAELKQLEVLALDFNQVTSLKPLTGLKGLKTLSIWENPELRRMQIVLLQAAVRHCEILNNAK